MSTTTQTSGSSGNSSRAGRLSAATASPSRHVSAASLHAIHLYGVVALVLIGLLAYYAAFRPLIQRHAFVSDEHSLINSTRAKLGQQQLKIAVQRELLAACRQSYQSHVIRLESSRKLNDRLASVSEVASRNDALIDDLQPDKSAAGVQFDSQPIHMTGSATLPAFARLLHQLRSEQADVGITTFDLTNTSRDEAAAKFTLNLVWYTEAAVKKDAPAGAVENPNVTKSASGGGK